MIAGKRSTVVAVLAVTGCLLGAASASPEPSSRGAEPAVIADGVVVDKKQNGLPGLPVMLYAVTSPQKDRARSVVLDAVKTGEGGEFSLTVENSDALQALAKQNDGWVNLDYVAGRRSLHVYRSLPRKFVAEEWVGAEDENFSTSMGAVVLAPGQAGVGGSRKSSAGRKPAAAAACSETSQVLSSKTLPTRIAELHTSNMTASLAYGPAADSTIDSAVTWDGGAHWSRSGTAHVGNTRTAVTRNATAAYHRKIRASFSYRKTRIVNTCYGERQVIKVDRWTGSVSEGTAATDPSGACANGPYSGNKETFTGSFTRNSVAAAKYTQAASLSAFGVPLYLGAASGYSGNMKVTWSGASSFVLCGDTDIPSVSRRIYAGA